MSESKPLTTAERAEWSQSLKPVVLGLSIAMIVLGNVGVLLRIWAQWRIKKRFGEDYWLIAAVLFSNVVSVATIVAVHYGLGYHVWRVEAEDTSGLALKWIFLCIWMTATFNGPSMLATKVTLLLWYRRMFIVQQRWLKVFWWSNMIYVVLWSVGSTLNYLLSCVPVNYYWERFDPNSTLKGSCHNTTNADGVPLILDLVSDVTILALPIATIATLKIPLGRKAGLMGVFSVGLIAVVSAIVRVAVLYMATNMHTDSTYALAPFELLDVVQLNVAIVCATAVPIISRVRLALRQAGSKGHSVPGTYGHLSSPSRRTRGGRQDGSMSSIELVRKPGFSTNEETRDGIFVSTNIHIHRDVE